MADADKTLGAAPAGSATPEPLGKLILAWGLVGLPLLWGIYQTGMKAAALFK